MLDEGRGRDVPVKVAKAGFGDNSWLTLVRASSKERPGQ